jgi:tetratricopeptide (TPR) repeat protein
VSAALLADGDVSDESTTSASGTNRVGAWRAFTRGRTALGRWDLSAATRELRAALALDPQYAQAQLWLAQGLAWSRPEHPEEWRSDALRAASLSASMSPTDSLFASGVAHLASEDFPAACDAYRRARTREPRSELPWFGIGQCQAMDSAVVRDARSPSGWRFRSSYHSAALAYDSALARTSGAPAFAFDRYLRLLFAESFRVRQGRLASSDTIRFLAHPSIDADTLAFVPYPSAKVAASAPGTLPATFALALSRNADRLGERFQEWVRRAPSSPDALAALAYAQEVRGEFEAREGGGLAALGTLRSAVRASRDTMQRIRLSTNIVRVLLKDERYAAAHAVADSLLAANPNPSQAQADYLAGIAALVGEVGRTEQLLAIASSAPDALPHGPYPRAVTTAVARLTANAALGVCDSRLPSLVQDVEQLVDRYVEPERRAAVRTQLLARPLSLAVPCLGPSIAERVLGATGRLGLMQRALARGDRSTVVANFDTLARMRRVDRVGDITLETTYQEAWILLAMRDTAGAQRQLCAPLSALPTLGTRLIRDVPQAASVGRALALCAQVAARRGDAASARHWAQAAAMLWSTADAPLRPMLADMKNLAALH